MCNQSAKDKAIEEYLRRHAPDVFCSACGEPPTPSDARWRWNGSSWEHKCQDAQSGYFPAVSKEEL